MVKKAENNGVALTTLACLQCGHTWFPRREEPPKICPHCKSRRWDQPDKEDPGDPEQQSTTERRIARALVEFMRRGHPSRIRALTRLIESERECLDLESVSVK